MEKKRALFVLRATRRIVAKLSVIVLIAFSMTTLVASAEPPSTSSGQALEITADQFWHEAMAAVVDRSEFVSMFSRVSAAAQQCCKICSTGKACGDTCIARDKTCQVGPWGVLAMGRIGCQTESQRTSRFSGNV
jgi:hypothetical protein